MLDSSRAPIWAVVVSALGGSLIMAAIIFVCWRCRRSRPIRTSSALDWSGALSDAPGDAAKAPTTIGTTVIYAESKTVPDDTVPIGSAPDRRSRASTASSETLCNPPSVQSAFNVSSYDVRSVGIALIPPTPRAVAFAQPPTESTESYRPWLGSERDPGGTTYSSAWSVGSPARERVRGFGGTFGSSESARSLPPARFSASTVSLDDDATIHPPARFSDSSFAAAGPSQRSTITSFCCAGSPSTGGAAMRRMSSGAELEQLHAAATGPPPARPSNRSVAITDPGLVANGFAF